MGKGGYWVPAQIEDKEITYTYERHAFVLLKPASCYYCKYCGLVRLKNKFTRWCIRMGCNNDYHPLFKRMRDKFTR